MAADSGGAAPVSHRRVLRLALPAAAAYLSTPLLSIADATVIGRLGEARLLAGVAAAGIVFTTLLWAFGFLRMGTAALVAQALGARDPEEERATLGRALLVAAGVGAAMIAFQAPIAAIAFRLMAATPEATAAARDWYDVRIWSTPFALANFALLGALLGRGRTDLGLVLQIGVNALNIALNVLFVAGLGWGVRGSALGTLIAEVAGAAAGLALAARELGGLGLARWRALVAVAPLRRMLVVNRDILIRSAALTAAFAFFAAQGARAGDVALAANAVLLNLFFLGGHFLDGFAIAAEQMCGQASGAGDRDGFSRAVRLSGLWCAAVAAALALGLWIGGDAAIDFVSTDAAVRAEARRWLPFAVAATLASAMPFLFDGVYVGATWTRDMRNLMIVALAVFLGVFYAARGLGNAGLWTALVAFFVARGGLQLWRYSALLASSFPTAQSPAARPTASSTR